MKREEQGQDSQQVPEKKRQGTECQIATKVKKKREGLI